MRVITGTARGTRLRTLEGDHTRPTVERVKEAVFSAIQFEINGRTALDLFAGSGQMGIEAISRGAVYCDFVDNTPSAVAIVQENVDKCRFGEQSGIHQKGYDTFLKQTDTKYSLVFIDPPYQKGLALKALNHLHELDRLARHAIVICETAPDEVLPDTVGPLALSRSTKYGNTRVHLYRTAVSEESL